MILSKLKCEIWKLGQAGSMFFSLFLMIPRINYKNGKNEIGINFCKSGQSASIFFISVMKEGIKRDRKFVLMSQWETRPDTQLP